MILLLWSCLIAVVLWWLVRRSRHKSDDYDPRVDALRELLSRLEHDPEIAAQRAAAEKALSEARAKLAVWHRESAESTRRVTKFRRPEKTTPQVGIEIIRRDT